jgi:glycosyltransferase involved in cell wall biosynthesis
MTLKEQLEILRGEPIQVYEGDPMNIPCIETSDEEKLCKNPVVSVHMITYNHEPYIRQAIEGVMMQQTDFEFELIIGEDASQDKTREICFEYQKKYPDKIRVLWWHENVSKLGGNSRRVFSRCRGEFIAFCEGDDYWTDPLKLQKQVDIMRENPNVGLCFCGAQINNSLTSKILNWNSGLFSEGEIGGECFFNIHLWGKDRKGLIWDETFLMTATILVRNTILRKAFNAYEIFNWRLALGDTTIWLGVSSFSNVYFLKDVVSVYNVHNGGVTQSSGCSVGRDGMIVRLFYLLKGKTKIKDIKNNKISLLDFILKRQPLLSKDLQRYFFKVVMKNDCLNKSLSKFKNIGLRILWKRGSFDPWMYRPLCIYLYYREKTMERLLLKMKSLFYKK